jgi:predicted transcriptional regulator
MMNLCQLIIDVLKSSGSTNKTSLFGLVGGNRNNFEDALQKCVDDGLVTKRTGSRNAVYFEAV